MPELVMEKKAMLVALEQLDKMLISTLNLEMRPGLCEIYRKIQSYDVAVVSVPGVLFNLMHCAKNAKPVEVPADDNSIIIGGIRVTGLDG
jgi:hypothetical protein